MHMDIRIGITPVTRRRTLSLVAVTVDYTEVYKEVIVHRESFEAIKRGLDTATLWIEADEEEEEVIT